LQIQTRVRFKLNSVSRDNSIRCFWFHSKHHLGKLAANSSSWTSGGCWYSTLLSSPTPPSSSLLPAVDQPPSTHQISWELVAIVCTGRRFAVGALESFPRCKL